MIPRYKIAAYTRISVDTELDKENTSIENQKAIIGEYCKLHFPAGTVDYFEDRDHSGYTFDQRPGYMSLRPKLFRREYDILIIKDLSRFSRRTGKGLSEFEDLAEAGVRIIAISDRIDYPICTDDWLKIKLYFFVNEMPVTDASNKVKAVVASRQEKGEWICSVPYGYVLTSSKKGFYQVDQAAAPVVRKIFELYNEGWGYQKIANYLTAEHIPTPRMLEKERKDAAGDEFRKLVRGAWSIITVSEILSNDFYIGTLRQHKYQRKKINGNTVELDASQHIVFEKNHPPLVDYRLFQSVQEQLSKRSSSHYRGIKKYENPYSGFLFCGDCGAPMFSMSRSNLAPAYRCGTYHTRGLSGCTSHHVRCDILDKVLKTYIQMVKDNCAGMLKFLEESIAEEEQTTRDSSVAIAELDKLLDEEKEQLKIMMRQKTRDVLRAGDNAKLVEQTYDELIAEASDKIKGLENQLTLAGDNRNTVIRVNRVAKTVMEIFDDILQKDKLCKQDLSFILDRMIVYEDHIDIKLKSDIDELLRTGQMTGGGDLASNFNPDTENIEKTPNCLQFEVVQSSQKRPDKVYRVSIISGLSPSRIRMVRRISFGMTTRPKSSILLTIPVAFIVSSFLLLFCSTHSVCQKRNFIQKVIKRDAAIRAENSEGEKQSPKAKIRRFSSLGR